MVSPQRHGHSAQTCSGENDRNALRSSRVKEASMKASASLLALVLVFGVAISCKLSERLGGDKNAGTVSELWPDVPPFQGATKADLEIPLGMRLLIRGMTQGKVNFISFRTDKPAQEVKDFYSTARMKAAGWTANDKGCTGDTEDTKNHGAICFF